MRRILSLLLLLFAVNVHAANIYVRDGGTGDGSAWNNALDQIPSPMVRGNIYYVADGNYDGFFCNVAPSGTSVIEVRKATEADHGTATGWLTTYGDGVAVLDGIGMDDTGYITVNGVFEYGFKITHLADDGGCAVQIGGFASMHNDNIQLKFCEIVGPQQGNGTYQFTNYTDCVRAITKCGTAFQIRNFLLSHCNVYGGAQLFQMCELVDAIFEYSKIHDCWDTPGGALDVHANVAFLRNARNLTFRYNDMYNWNAQGFYPSGFVAGDFHIYGNYFHDNINDGNNAWAIWFFEGGAGDAEFGNVFIYNNTFANLWNGAVRLNGSFTNITGGAMRNNLFYNVGAGGVQYNNLTHTNNWYSGSSNGETNGVFGGSANPFNGIPQISSTVSSTLPRNKGFALSSPYNVDSLGVIRGTDGLWDIGAYEVAGTDTTAPALSSAVIPSTGATITLNFSENVDVVNGTGWALSMSGGAVTATYSSGTGSTALVYTLSRTIAFGETGTISYTTVANGIEDIADNDLASIPASPGFTVTNNTIQGQVLVPSLSLASGQYFGTQSVTATSGTSGATFYYTTDGSNPDSGDSLWVNPKDLSSGGTYKIIATKATLSDSPIATYNYEIGMWSTGSTSGTWKSFDVTSQSGIFEWRFRAISNIAANNAVIGLASSLADDFTDFGPIIRFFTNGQIDARNGAAYEAINTITYTATPSYYDFVCTVNQTARTYSATVATNGGAAVVLATNYDFRSDQTNPTGALSHFGFQSGAAGSSVSVSNMSFDTGAPTGTVNCNTLNVTTLRIGP